MIRIQLQELGWSQLEFARRVGVDKNTVGRWIKKGNKLAELYLELKIKCKRLGE